MKKFLFLIFSLTAWPALQAQEEAVELSSFVVSTEADRNYVQAFAPAPNVAITVRKPATAVVMEVTLTNMADKPDARNRELYATIEQIEKAVTTSPGLRLEKREIQLRGEVRKRTLLSKNGAVASVASIAIYAELTPDKDLFRAVKTIRTVLSSVSAVGTTKILDGAVSFVIKDVDQYRQEILTKIFADMEFIKKGLGPNFEVLPSGLDGPILTRPASEKEVELWIQYRFSIRSVLELSTSKAKTG